MASKVDLQRKVKEWVAEDFSDIRKFLMRVIRRDKDELDTDIRSGGRAEGIVKTPVKPSIAMAIQACKQYHDLFMVKIMAQKKWDKDDAPDIDPGAELTEIAKDIEADKKQQAKKKGKVAKKEIGHV